MAEGFPQGQRGIKKAPSRTQVLRRPDCLHSVHFHVRTTRHFYVTQSGQQISKDPKRLSRSFWRRGH